MVAAEFVKYLYFTVTFLYFAYNKNNLLYFTAEFVKYFYFTFLR